MLVKKQKAMILQSGPAFSRMVPIGPRVKGSRARPANLISIEAACVVPAHIF